MGSARAVRPPGVPARLAAAVLVVACIGGCGAVTDRLPWRASAGSSGPAAAGGADGVPAAPGTALAALDALPVAPFRLVDGYDRDAFGQRWADVDRNGCDTRNDVLRRDLAQVGLDPRTRGCVVRTGRLTDPYTGETVAFVRGPQTSPLVEIDHVVALAAAWRTGAWDWPPPRREEFANDPLNLLATSRASNQGKAALDAAGWLPPRAASRCPFVARQVAVKRRWGLTVTPPERTAMRRVLATCPGVPLPG
ncbi:HNH endonuclease family protein [Kineosporia sp. A_224]|uniref:HNH endonuclease family protein n=1 Tax=Kineosporia sp. A_224 TaxID=1962180 RepID=UPI000B4AFAD7|nr:HNH endonuclease family protein [Kineosporia sp. A_224]